MIIVLNHITDEQLLLKSFWKRNLALCSSHTFSIINYFIPDVNECSTNRTCDLAVSVCNNTLGSYTCDCMTGYHHGNGGDKICTGKHCVVTAVVFLYIPIV